MLSSPRKSTLLVAAVICCCGWNTAHARSVCGADTWAYDRTYPTDLWLEWNSSSGAGGRIEYFPNSPGMGGAVPDERGSGGLRRRVVFAPPAADWCKAFPNMTTSYRGQAAGVPYKDKFVLFLFAKSGRPCFTSDSYTKSPIEAGAAGVMSMYTDEQPENDGRLKPHGWDLSQKTGATRMTIPFASFTRDRPGTNGGMPMAREIMAGHEVEVFWPGTGPIDPTERAALKELYKDGIANWIWNVFALGTNGNMYRADFLADDTVDPCGGSGNPNTKLEGITCIGGHIVNLDFGHFGTTQLQSIPASISKLKHLRSIYHIARQHTGDATVITFPESFGDLSMLHSLSLCGSHGRANQALRLPSTMGKLKSLTMLEIEDFDITGSFPDSIFSLGLLSSIVLNKVPLTSLPAVSSMTALITFSLNSNGLTAMAPSFKGLSKLESVSFAGNKLTGGSKDMFDGCMSLVTVDVTDNRLDCDLPSFKDCTELMTIKLSNNALTGAVPAEYAMLQKVLVLDASHNAIGGTGKSVLSPLKAMTSLVNLDLSHNVLEYEYDSTCLAPCEMSEYVQRFVGTNVRFLDLSHNRLVGPPNGHITAIGASAPTVPRLVSVDFSHNELIGWFDTTCIAYNVDFSYNNASGIELDGESILQTGGPGEHVQFASIKFKHQSPPNGTPQRFSSSAMGPTYASMDASHAARDWSSAAYVPGFEFEHVEHPRGSGQFPFICPRWHARKFPELAWEMDPEIYDFHGGSTAALRRKWISNKTDSADYIAGFEKHF
eukprot:g7553.t1